MGLGEFGRVITIRAVDHEIVVGLHGAEVEFLDQERGNCRLARAGWAANDGRLLVLVHVQLFDQSVHRLSQTELALQVVVSMEETESARIAG